MHDDDIDGGTWFSSMQMRIQTKMNLAGKSAINMEVPQGNEYKKECRIEWRKEYRKEAIYMEVM